MTLVGTPKSSRILSLGKRVRSRLQTRRVAEHFIADKALDSDLSRVLRRLKLTMRRRSRLNCNSLGTEQMREGREGPEKPMEAKKSSLGFRVLSGSESRRLGWRETSLEMSAGAKL